MSRIVNVNGTAIRVVDGAVKPFRTANSAFKTLDAAVSSVSKFASQMAAERDNQVAALQEVLAKQATF